VPDTVKVPGLGPTNKKWVYAGGALIVGLVGYAYWTRAKQAPVVEPVNPDALPEDRVPFTDQDVSSGAGQSFSGGLPTTVAEWVQRATDRLAEFSADPLAVAAALGKFVTRQQLTATEADIVRQAIGQFGPPPGETLPILLLPPNTPPPVTSAPRHKYVTQLHIVAENTPVRTLVQRFSNPDPKISTGNNIQTATVATQADPRNRGDIRNGIALKQHGIYVHTVQAA
jgi:hypothetical protein